MTTDPAALGLLNAVCYLAALGFHRTFVDRDPLLLYVETKIYCGPFSRGSRPIVAVEFCQGLTEAKVESHRFLKADVHVE